MASEQSFPSDNQESLEPAVDARRWRRALTAWWLDASLMRDLAADSCDRREAAIGALTARGTGAVPLLCRALRGCPTAACAAAAALSRVGAEIGVQTVLIRCYDEEWLSEQPLKADVIGALRQLDLARIGSALVAGLVSAPAERQLQACFDRLTLALSAFRLLPVYDTLSPFAWWERGIYFGRSSLPKLRDHPFAGLAYALTDHIRSAGLRGMLAQYPSEAFALLAQCLQADDFSVMRTAVAGLHKIRDARALPLLQPIAFTGRHPLALEARKAIETIAGSDADPLTLVRGSSADTFAARYYDLMRPAAHDLSKDTAVLLRILE